MNNSVEYHNNPDDSKKQKGFRFAGFYITYKALFIVLGIFAIIFIYNEIKTSQKEAEIRRRNEEAMQASQNVEPAPEPEVYDYHKILQESLVEQYGEPPEGFEWDMLGNLVSLVNEENMTYEDVAYSFIRSCSILDFSTAAKYSVDSYIIATFKDYYEDIYTMVDYYSNFLRKQYKYSLTTLEVNDVKDIAIMADGTAIISINVSCLDLQNKDFWLPDQKEIFEEMYYYEMTENDTTKSNEYLYDYIYKSYENGKVGKNSFDIDLIIGKKNGGGWYVANDSELRDVLSYEMGKDVAAYISELYQSYCMKRALAEGLGEEFYYEELEGSSDYNEIQIE